jgi:hypothetical protein
MVVAVQEEAERIATPPHPTRRATTLDFGVMDSVAGLRSPAPYPTNTRR